MASDFQDLIDNCPLELEMVGRSVESLKPFTELPYPRITYKEAIEMLQKGGLDVKYGDDFGSPEETYLADQFQKPVFIKNYPKEIKAFYMPTDPEDDRQVICADLLAPEGYGEIIGGSERSYDYDYITSKLEENGLSLCGLSPDSRIVEMIEIPSHPWFIATQAHPELKSRPNRPHPLFKGFVEAALRKQGGQ